MWYKIILCQKAFLGISKLLWFGGTTSTIIRNVCLVLFLCVFLTGLLALLSVYHRIVFFGYLSIFVISFIVPFNT